MKQRLVGVLCLITSVGAFAQGQLDFRNRNATVTPIIDAPITDIDGTTKLSGAGFLAQLYFSTTGASGSFTAVTDPAAPFRTGAGVGYWDYGADFARTLPGVAAGSSVWFLVRVWDAASGSFAAAQTRPGGKWGQSNNGAGLSVLTGGPTVPPSAPGVLVFTSFQVPEPSTIALGLLGAAALLLRRRK